MTTSFCCLPETLAQNSESQLVTDDVMEMHQHENSFIYASHSSITSISILTCIFKNKLHLKKQTRKKLFIRPWNLIWCKVSFIQSYTATVKMQKLNPLIQQMIGKNITRCVLSIQ